MTKETPYRIVHTCTACHAPMGRDQTVHHCPATGETVRLTHGGAVAVRSTTLPPLQFVCATCGGPVDRTGQTQHDCPGPARDAIQSSFRTASPQCEQPVPPPVAPEHLTEVGRRVRVPK